jgi:uncharacterized protein (TIGR03086 family)
MAAQRPVPPVPGGIALLERAITYALGSLRLVTPDAMDNPTPCAEWNLQALLRHLDDSFLVLEQALTVGRVEVVRPEHSGPPTGMAAGPPPDAVAVPREPHGSIRGLPAGLSADAAADRSAGLPADPVVALRNRASRMLGACASVHPPDVVSVGGWPLRTGLVTSAGAVEVAVHGWDVARACGQDRPIPAGLAAELLRVAPLVVADADRPTRFAAPVPVPPLAGPGDRLLAFLGRQPNPTPRRGGTTVITAG